MRAMQLSEIHSPASPQLATSARRPPGAKGAGQRWHGAKRALSLNVSGREASEFGEGGP
jgi:hypothetical protein